MNAFRWTQTEPTTLVEVYEAVARNHPKTNNLNYKREALQAGCRNA